MTPREMEAALKVFEAATQRYRDAALKDALWLVAADLCPKMTDTEFNELWAGYLELRRYKEMQ